MRYVVLCLVMVWSCGQISAQDKLFTQSFAHPVDLNPAFAGNVDGKYRVTVAYRDQWQKFVESPFTTLGVYGDIKINLENRNEDFFGAGFSVISDRTDIFDVNQNVISLYGSYHKALNADAKRYLSAGFSMGIAQRNLNYEQIYFHDQFNGLDQYSLTTNEILPANNFAFFDIGLGVAYTAAMGTYSSMSLGLAVDHLPGSSASFYNRSLDDEENDYPEFTMYRKISAYWSMELASNEYVSLLPRIHFQQEGPYTMLATAALVKFDITNYDNQALHLGGGVRFNQSATSSFSPSAVYLMTAYELNGLLIGLSHDVTLGRLGGIQPGFGAFELSIGFTGFYENDESMCPTF